METLTEKEKFVIDLIEQGKKIVDIIKENPDEKIAIMRVLYRSMSLAVISKIFADAGVEISRQGIHPYVVDIIREVKPISAPRPAKKISEAKKKRIVTLYNNGVTTDNIRKKAKVDFYTIKKVLAENGIDSPRSYRPVKIGDTFGNWLVIEFVKGGGKCLCRDLRNGHEQVVTFQNLRTGSSKGCRALSTRNTAKPKATLK